MWRVSLRLLVFVTISASLSLAGSYTFSIIADPNTGPGRYGGQYGTYPSAINNAGQVVGTYVLPPYCTGAISCMSYGVGFEETAGVFKDLGIYLGPRAINNSGDIVGVSAPFPMAFHSLQLDFC